MCGITGAVWSEPRWEVTPETLQKMTDSIAHRGPDDAGAEFIRLQPEAGHGEIGAALGFRRLSIIDLEGGHQPLCNEDGTVWLVFNGEIYNYLDLRRRLEGNGHKFRTESDSETIVHLYEDLGPACFEHLNGMFAIAIWDSRKRCLLLARDRLGKKPLYYAHREGQLAFGSELKCLVQVPEFSRQIDPRAIDLFLTYEYIPHPHTIYKASKKLPPGHYAVWQDNKLTVDSYWKVNFAQEAQITHSDAVDRLRELFADAVRLRLRSDVPLGAFLSGGIDSSLVVRIAQDQMTQPIRTFSIGFSVNDYDETHFARQVAEQVGSVHEEFRVTPDAVSILDRLAFHYDEPFGDSSAIPTWYLSELTKSRVTVALSGDGGDELFAGYDRYRALVLSQRIAHFPGVSLLGSSLIQSLPSSQRRQSFIRRLQRFGEAITQPAEIRYLQWLQIFPEVLRANLYRDDFVDQLPNEDPIWFLKAGWKRSGNRDLITHASLADLVTYLPCDLMCKVDIASMAHGLEARTPFLDYRLVEFAASLPSKWKFRSGKGKRILRDAFGPRLPAQIWNRPKMGFGVPIANWFRKELRQTVQETLLSEDARCRQIFRFETVRDLVEDHVSGRRNHGYRLWSLLMLEHWWRRWEPTL